jgi:hypothetical protein
MLQHFIKRKENPPLIGDAGSEYFLSEPIQLGG